MIRMIFFLLTVFFPLLLISQNTKKVCVIGIDGCRADALQAANTPNIDNLISNGIFSPDALNDDITSSGPGWSAILCGVWSDKHLVTDNSFVGDDYENYPPFFKHINDFNPDLNTVSICHWSPINEFIVQEYADVKINVGTDLEVAVQATNFLSQENPDVLFLHFDDVDHAGHGFGYSINVPQYISSIEGIDIYVGSVIQAIEQRASYEAEDWLIMVTTDHGGIGTGHGGNSIEEKNIFIVASGNSIEADLLLKDSSIISDAAINCLGDSIELKFDGNDDFVQVSPNPIFDFGADQDFTIECRVRTPQAADVAIIGNKDWDSGVNKGFIFSFRFSSGPEWKVNIGDGENRTDLNTGGEIADNEWHTLSVSFDRDGLMKMYQDGSIIDSADISLIGDINTNGGLFFGADINSAFDFSGSIAEVRVWNTLVSGTAIEDWNCTTLDNAHPNYSALIGYWKMNEGMGNLNVLDYSPNGNNGSINGATWIGPDSIVVYDYSSTPRQTDILPTILTHLCIPISADWALDGISLIPTCLTTNVSDQTLLIGENNFQLFPNPAKDEVFLNLNNSTVNQPIQLEIYSSIGSKIFEQKVATSEVAIDVSEFAAGVYFFTIRMKQGWVMTKRLVISSKK